jgi:hypothetical protein
LKPWMSSGKADAKTTTFSSGKLLNNQNRTQVLFQLKNVDVEFSTMDSTAKTWVAVDLTSSLRRSGHKPPWITALESETIWNLSHCFLHIFEIPGICYVLIY